jgi:hypothetical protein
LEDAGMSAYDDSLFISDTIHEKEITGANGKPVTIWLKELPNTAFVRMQQALASKDIDMQSESIPRIVSQAVVDKGGEQAMTFEQACRLKLPVLNQLFNLAIGLNKDDDAGNA